MVALVTQIKECSFMTWARIHKPTSTMILVPPPYGDVTSDEILCVPMCEVAPYDIGDGKPIKCKAPSTPWPALSYRFRNPSSFYGDVTSDFFESHDSSTASCNTKPVFFLNLWHEAQPGHNLAHSANPLKLYIDIYMCRYVGRYEPPGLVGYVGKVSIVLYIGM